MDAKEYLSQIRKLEHKIYCMKLRYEEYEKMSLTIPGPTYGEKIGTNPNRNTDAPFLKWLYKKDELERDIIALEEKLKEFPDRDKYLKKEHDMKLLTLIDKKILIKRYFEGKTWDEIATIIFVSRSTVKRWHEEAINILSKKIIV